MLEGLESLVELGERFGSTGSPRFETGHRAVGADRCYFSAPASLPDDPAQPSGTLLLTATRAIFVGGARGVTIPWHGVGAIQRHDRDLVLVRTDRQDLHRHPLQHLRRCAPRRRLARHFAAAASRRRV